jgi:hypothetical protein
VLLFLEFELFSTLYFGTEGVVMETAGDGWENYT